MSLVDNERTKLLAAALNTTGTSCFTIGVLAPLAAAFYNVEGSNRIAAWIIFAGVGVWFLAAVTLHLGARRVLGGLKE